MAARGIQSIEIGYRVLLALQEGPDAVTLKEAARRAGLTASAAHNYLTSFMRTGMVQTDGRGLYRLGPSLVGLGLAAMSNTDQFEAVRDEALALSRKTGFGTAVVVCNDGKPAIIFQNSRVQRRSFDLRTGPIPLMGTASGLVFLTYVKASRTVALSELAKERISGKKADKLIAEVQERVRAAGYASLAVRDLSGYWGIAAPVWGMDNTPEFALALVGPQKEMEGDVSLAQVLLEGSRRLSRSFGAAARHWPM